MDGRDSTKKQLISETNQIRDDREKKIVKFRFKKFKWKLKKFNVSSFIFFYKIKIYSKSLNIFPFSQ